MSTPAIGRIVHYTLNALDAAAINNRRHEVPENTNVIHFGNRANEGDVFPAIIVRVWNEDPGTVQLQVFLDGNDTYWATSRLPGDVPGSYAWPVHR